MIVVLNILDVITTYACLKLGASEGNPIAKWMLETGTLPFFKVAICGWLLATVMLFTPKNVSLTVVNAAWFVAGIYSFVIVLNTAHLLALL